MPDMIKAVSAAFMLAIAAVGAPGTASAQYWQCAPYARLISGIQLFGNAASWWTQAAGRYARGMTPAVGAILSFKSTRRMQAGHVAMVSKVIDARTIKVDHANWSVIGGSRGQVERDATVIDVSPGGDWSQVRVWYAPLAGLGTSAYPTNGFIYKAPAGSGTETVAEPRLVFQTAGLIAQ